LDTLSYIYTIYLRIMEARDGEWIIVQKRILRERGSVILCLAVSQRRA